MKNQIVRTFALLAGGAAFGSAALHATEIRSDTVSVPFSFRVANATLPAGTYRIEQAFGSDIAMVVNVQTGHRIQMIRFSPLHREGKLRLVFENTPAGEVLKQIQ